MQSPNVRQKNGSSSYRIRNASAIAFNFLSLESPLFLTGKFVIHPVSCEVMTSLRFPFEFVLSRGHVILKVIQTTAPLKNIFASSFK